MDPLAPEYPWYTPYQFAGNTPIQAIDLDGMEEIHYTMTVRTNGEIMFSLLKTGGHAQNVYTLIHEQSDGTMKSAVVSYGLYSMVEKAYNKQEYDKWVANIKAKQPVVGGAPYDPNASANQNPNKVKPEDKQESTGSLYLYFKGFIALMHQVVIPVGLGINEDTGTDNPDEAKTSQRTTDMSKAKQGDTVIVQDIGGGGKTKLAIKDSAGAKDRGYTGKKIEEANTPIVDKEGNPVKPTKEQVKKYVPPGKGTGDVTPK